jgi:repressor LexA
LEFIERYTRQHGHPPSQRDIQRARGLRSVSTAAYHVNRLQEEGLIKRERKIARSIRVTKKGLRRLDRGEEE